MTDHQDKLLEEKLKQCLGIQNYRSVFIVHFTDERKPRELFTILKDRGFNIKETTTTLPYVVDRPLFSLEMVLSESEARDFLEKVRAFKIPILTLDSATDLHGDEKIIKFLQEQREAQIQRN